MAKKKKHKKDEEKKKPDEEEKGKKAKKQFKEKATQPEINIGMVGHVDHGKTTLVKALSGKWTDTHSEELKRGITIRLGYADATLYKCKKCKGVEAYGASPECAKCGGKAERLRGISLVDAPGHESLMATMISGGAILDGAILLIAANEQCPQPQTIEHLIALEIIGVENLIVVQNKIDLVDEKEATKNYKQIKAFLKQTRYKDAVIIPMSAQHSINIDAFVEAVEKYIKTPKRDPKKDPVMFIARSFDINKPGTTIDDFKGGVLGGSLKQGKFKVGEEIDILPGYEVEEKNKKVWKPLKTKITGMVSGSRPLDEVAPGGSIGVMTTLDPSIIKSDKLAGALAGHIGKLPPVLYDLELDVYLLPRVVGAKDKLVVEPIKMSEILMLNVNAAATVGVVNELHKKSFKCSLKRPVCASKGARVTISRRFGNRWRLIGYGIIK